MDAPSMLLLTHLEEGNALTISCGNGPKQALNIVNVFFLI